MSRTRSVADEMRIKEYLLYGMKNALNSKRVFIYLAVLLFLIWHCSKQDMINKIISCFFIVLIILLWMVIFESEFIKNFWFEKRFKRIHFYNKENEYPYLVAIKKMEDGSCNAKFKSKGITQSDWIDNKHRIENVLDITIFGINMEESNDTITLQYTKGLYDYTKTQIWNDNNMYKDNYIRIGMNGMGIIKFNFNNMPHILIGGSSGSGKSVLMKIILYQCIKKKYKVFLADFKGAVDYKKCWRQKCNIIVEMEVFYNKLSLLKKWMDERLVKLYKSECSDIEEYNCQHKIKMIRTILAVDEFADVLEKGSDKETKEMGQSMIRILTEIARKGRAVGINLILSTQRPDAVVLPSAIKNNMLYRIAGKCDDNLSRIILENGDAATEIPTNTTGVFLDSEGNLFKGFYAIDKDLKI